MGTFRIEIEAQGGHGCDREKGDGATVYGCGLFSCPDCQTRNFIRTLADRGITVASASLTHWPGQPSEVRDDLVTRIRSGSF